MASFRLLFVTLATLPCIIGQNKTFGEFCRTVGPHCNLGYNLVCGTWSPAGLPSCACAVREGVQYVRYKKMPEACVHPNQIIESRTYNESCENEGCLGQLFCDLDSNSTLACHCPTLKALWNNVTEVCEGLGPGARCDYLEASTCDIGPCSVGECHCYGEKPIFNMFELKCQGRQCDPLVNDCPETFKCYDGFCLCPTDFDWDGSTRCAVRMGGECTANEQCLQARNAECVDGKCVCVANYVLHRDKICKSKIVSFGGKCQVNEDCLPQKGLDCINSKCSCAVDFEWGEGRCMSKVDLTACDPHAKEDQCVAENLVKYQECDKDKKICACPKRSEYSETAMACKLKSGHNCLVENTLEHGLCRSGRCSDGSDAMAIYGICGCPDGVEGQRRIWSSDPGQCVDDKFGYPCTKDEDCLFPKFKAGQKGLVCHKVEQRCLCQAGYSYQHAYCVKDEHFKGHESPCDPQGTLACNVTGTGLFCRSNTKGNHTCLCLPKDIRRMTNATSEKYVFLEWDDAKKKCGLKADGRKCGEGVECRSSKCVTGTCVAENFKGGAKSVGDTYAGLTVLLALGMQHHLLKTSLF